MKLIWFVLLVFLPTFLAGSVLAQDGGWQKYTTQGMGIEAECPDGEITIPRYSYVTAMRGESFPHNGLFYYLIQYKRDDGVVCFGESITKPQQGGSSLSPFTGTGSLKNAIKSVSENEWSSITETNIRIECIWDKEVVLMPVGSDVQYTLIGNSKPGSMNLYLLRFELDGLPCHTRIRTNFVFTYGDVGSLPFVPVES